MLYSGIDLHKRDLVIATVDAAGHSVTAKRIKPTSQAVRAYFEQFPPETEHRAVVEATRSWYWLCDVLRTMPQTAPVTLTLANHGRLRAISAAKVKTLKTLKTLKTDAVDADTLAQLLRADLIPEAHMVSAELREIRDLLRTRLEFVRRHARCRNAVGSLMAQYNVSAVSLLPPLARASALLQLEQDAMLQDHAQRIERALRPALVRTDPVRRLLTIPGIGLITAYTIYLEVDGIERFSDFRHFASYARLVGGSDNFGGKVRNTRSRSGNAHLKLVFAHAAVRAAQHYPEIRAWYERMARRKGKPLAHSLVAKELGRIAFAILSKGESFNGQFKGRQVIRPKVATGRLPAAGSRFRTPEQILTKLSARAPMRNSE